MRDARRLKSWSLIGGVLLGGMILLAWTGQWFALTLNSSEAQAERLSVGGDVAAPGLIALALAALALVAALAIAGRVFRIVLALVEMLLGFTVGLSAILAITGPVAASAKAVTDATGVSGADSIAALVTSVDFTGWPWFAVVSGVLTLLFGLFILLTSRRWPGSSRKYQAVRLESSEDGKSAVSDWDSLSTGNDPT